MKLVKQILRILYPQTCPVCGEIVMPVGELICPGCKEKVSYIKGPTCMKCGKSVESERTEYCFDCRQLPKNYKRNLALVNYTPVISSSLSKVKYHNCRQNLDFFCEEILYSYGKIIQSWRAQALIPVPIHPSRRRKRGFNQTEEMGKRLEERLKIPMDCNILFRYKKTMPQKELSDRQRLKNLEQAFTASLDAGRKYQTVILLDDIYTTGSTAEACTKALKRAGVKNVYMLTIAIGKGM